MKYLADTDVIVDHIRGKNAIKQEILDKGLGISIITYGELLYGAEKSGGKEKTLGIVTDLINDLSIQIINLNESIMSEYARLKANLESKGMKLHEFDLLIASTAKQNNLFLLTRKIKHFGRVIDLKILH